MKNQNLISFRKDKQLSVSAMADKVGISSSYYEKIEYGDRNQSYRFLSKFKQAFPEADTDYIFFIKQSHALCR